jgi:hypothetical protein
MTKIYIPKFYTNITERSTKDSGDDGAQGFRFLPTVIFPSTFLCAVNQSRALITSERYHVVIATNIHVDRIPRRLDGAVEYAGEVSVRASGRCREGLSHWTSFHGLSIVRNAICASKPDVTVVTYKKPNK